MIRKLKFKYSSWILGEFFKYFAVGGHCGLCGKWVDDAVVNKQGRVTVCDDCGNISLP